MASSIPVSEKHGVNPSLTMCVFCHEAKGIALLGRLPNDAEAPRQIITDYEPCDKCQEQMNQGITMVGTLSSPLAKDMPPIGKDENGDDLYIGTTWLVVSEDYIKRIIEWPKSEEILKAKRVLVPDDMAKELINSIPKQ